MASGWRKNDAALTAAYAGVTQRMLQSARVGAGDRVLDVACGGGEPAISAAEHVGPGGRVLATDFVEEMLQAARDKAARKRLTNIEFRRVDGEVLEVASGSIDAALMRWGLMFMPDPVVCLRRVRVALRSGGRIAVACWTAPAENPWVSSIIGALRKHVEVPAAAPGTPNIFAFADPARLRSVLEEAGFVDVEVEAVTATFLPSASGAAHFALVRELAAPIARLASRCGRPVTAQ